MPRIKEEDIVKYRDPRDRYAYVQKIAQDCAADDPIQLSDPLANKTKWGSAVLRALGTMMTQRRMERGEEMKWKIRVLRDEWNNKLGPGDIVIKKTQGSLLDEQGQPLKPEILTAAMIDGSYEERFVKKTKYKIDAKGCIECDFEDAVYFLNVWGLHQATGRPLSTKRELSAEPVNTPNGQKLHCHYWRFQEVDRQTYKGLPKLDKRTEPLRGIDSASSIEQFDADAKYRNELEAEQRKQEIAAQVAAEAQQRTAATGGNSNS